VPVPLIPWRLQCPLQESRAVVEPESNNDTQIKDVTREQDERRSYRRGKDNSQTAKLTKGTYVPDVVQQVPGCTEQATSQQCYRPGVMPSELSGVRDSCRVH
jgi:hypothetical protein